MRGGAVMLGYWDRPEDTAETLRGGWLHTGDLGRIDEHGYVYLLDRAKDMIISGGSNVYAVEVEAVLGRPPGRPRGRRGRDAGPDLGGGRHRGGRSPRRASTPSELAVGAGRALRRHAWPATSGLVASSFRDVLPRNAYGKVLKRSLREELAEA